MDSDARRAAARMAAINSDLPKIAALTYALDALLAGGAEAAGRVSVQLDVRNHSFRPVFTTRGQRQPAAWVTELPVLMLDATGRIEDVRRVFPDAELAETPRAETPHFEYRQITGGFGRSTLSRNPKKQRELRDFILLNTIGKTSALVVTHKSQEANFASIEGIATGHHGAIAGSDEHATAEVAFIIGGAFPSPEAAASIAAARGGGAVVAERPIRATRSALLTSGMTVPVEVMTYADPAADAVHQGVYAASIIQAAGRLRPTERTANSPGVVWIMGNVALPFPVASVTPWRDVRPDRLGSMVAGGAVWANTADMATFRPDIFRTPKAAEHSRARDVGRVVDIREAVSAIVQFDPRAWVEVTFQPSGQGQRRRQVFAPAGQEAALHAAITAEYGVLTRWEVCGLTPGREESPGPGITTIYPDMGESYADLPTLPAWMAMERHDLEQRPPPDD